IGRDGHDLERRLPPGRTQYHPQAGAARREIVAIVRRIGAIESDLGVADVEPGRLVVALEDGPWRGGGRARQRRDPPPAVIDPLALRLAALDHDADPGRRKGTGPAHRTASCWRTGSPVTRFCGFMRRVLSGVIARIK